MANYVYPWWPIQRLTYFDGDAIYDQDMINEQVYQVGLRMRSMRTMRTPGIADGFQLASSGPTLYVSPGTAFDAWGNALALVPSNFQSQLWPPTASSGNWLVVLQGQYAGWWSYDCSQLPKNAMVLFYVSWNDTPANGPPEPGGAYGQSRWQLTPIMDYTLAQVGWDTRFWDYQALMLGTVIFDGSNLKIGYTTAIGNQTVARQYAGLMLPGPDVAPPSTMPQVGSTPVTLLNYLRVASDGVMELGGADGVALGLTDPTVAPPDTTDAAPFTAALSIGSDSNVTFNQLTLSSELDTQNVEIYGGKGLTFDTSAETQVNGTLTVGAKPLLTVTDSEIQVQAPMLILSGTVSAPSLTIAGMLQLGAQPLIMSNSGGTAPLGFVGQLNGPSIGLAGSQGVTLGVSQSGAFTSLLTVTGSQATAAGALTVPTGNVNVTGAATFNGDCEVDGLITGAAYNATVVIDSTLQPNSDTISGNFTTTGGAVIVSVIGALFFFSTGQDPLPTTTSITVSLGGTQLGNIVVESVFGYWQSGGLQGVALAQVPLTTYPVAAATVKPGTHTLTIAGLASTNGVSLFATVIEIPNSQVSS